MQSQYAFKTSADPMANMMLSSSIWLVLKKYQKKRSFAADDYNILSNGVGLLQSIQNGYRLVNPLEAEGFSPSIADMNIFNDASGVFFRGKNSIDIHELEDYIKAITPLMNGKEYATINRELVKQLVEFFEKLTEQFFIHANKYK